MPATPPRSNRRLALAFAVVTLLSMALLFLWLNRKSESSRQENISEEAAQANSRGVGFMEQFEYAKATVEFQKAADLAPKWLPARINLGMALYNSASSADDPVLPKAISVFEQILKEEPDNPYAHFNLGIITKYRGDYKRAASHFEAVTKFDPSDDRAWLYLGQSDPEMQSSQKAKSYFEKALSLNPYLVPARYAIANHLETTAEDQAKLHELNRKLQSANWEDEARPDRHSEQGRYATAIGKVS
ncbi:MAG: tetratricopeptide repeat protein [Gemmataceae bacterium]